MNHFIFKITRNVIQILKTAEKTSGVRLGGGMKRCV